MPDLTGYLMGLIPLAIAGALIWLYLRKRDGSDAEAEKKIAYQGVVKRDWVATGRIDFATQEHGGSDDADRPAEFKLLVEERRIVESIAGNENLEIQWRLASLKEAKMVIANYHKYLGDHGLIKSVSEERQEPPAAVEAPPAAAPPASQPALAGATDAAGTPETEPHMRVVAGGNP